MEKQCALQTLIGPLIGKWKAEIIFNLKDGPLRLSDIERRIPDANPRVLKRQLRSLESDKIVQRVIYSDVPTKVEYSLTEHGKLLFPLLVTVDRTVQEYLEKNELNL